MDSQGQLAQEKRGYVKVEAPCSYFGTCGGCTLQDLAYPDQLAFKQQRLQRAFAPWSDLPPIELMGLEEPWRYRNKIELTFGQIDGHITLGYHAARSFWRIVDLEECLLAPTGMAPVWRDVRSLAERTGLPAYHPRTHQGFFRHLILRQSQATGQLLACLITTSGHHEIVEALGRTLIETHPEIASLSWGTTERLADIAAPETLTLLHGTPHLEDRLGPFRLELPPFSFLQPCGIQAHRMYTHLCQAIGERPNTIAWDLYCGVGLVGFYLSERVQRIYGIELDPRQVTLGQRHAELNGIHNVEFRAGRVETLLMDRRFWLQEAKPDVIVVDPPRAGLHPRAVSSLLAARPQTVAYLSCNLQSLLRDLTVFCAGFPRYHLRQVTAFDMFPQTAHLEVLAVLER